MRHRVKKPRLGRNNAQRKALVRSQLNSLLKNGRLCTTESRAKVLAAEFDSLVALVKRQPDAREQIRSAKQVLFEEVAQRNLIEKVIPAIKGNSGFSRLTKLGPRSGDAAEKVQIEILSFEA